ncbi:hypothetical protein [Aeromonas bivalvium]|uniref:hypothetical protein n=1 Tax=Aeromonas bivalvium TaxID=440079 RepID=UPI0012FA2C52|nr:hypothetical protein [Aeromonas bivalvium]
MLAKHFNQLRRDSVEAGFNAGSGSADVRHCLITQFILLGHPDLPHLEFIPQPPREQCYTQPEDGHRCQRRLRARTYTYQVSGYIIDSSYPQPFTELIRLDTPLLSGKDFFQMTQHLRNHLLGAIPSHPHMNPSLLVTEFNLLHDPVYDLSDAFHSTVARCSDGMLRDNGICVASS